VVGAPLDLSIDELRELCCRAIDAAGNVQPLTPRGTSGGTRTMQRVAVHVVA